jgi:hypothetical protein
MRTCLLPTAVRFGPSGWGAAGAAGPDAATDCLLARLFADLTSPHPDYDALGQLYWKRGCRIYNRLPDHGDPRPRGNTERFVRHS